MILDARFREHDGGEPTDSVASFEHYKWRITGRT
jgi:hypothetical protein